MKIIINKIIMHYDDALSSDGGDYVVKVGWW